MHVPNRLRSGDEVRVIAPSTSMAIITEDSRALASERFGELGLTLTFGDHVDECDDFFSSSIEHRVEDLHAAFADPDVAAIMTVIGGYNANQLLPYIDWDLIEANPKIFCGYSDITALSAAIYAKTGLVTYSGPHFTTFGMKRHLEQTRDWFRAAMFDGGRQQVASSATWSDDRWYEDQDNRTIEANEGPWVLQPGEAAGPLVGGNLCTLNLLQGTEYMPEIAGTIMVIEDDLETERFTFNRDLTSLTQLPSFADVQAVLIGRFQRAAEISREILTAIVASNHALRDIPVVANMDFGHTDPIMTLPIGGAAELVAEAADRAELMIDYGATS